MKNDVCDRWNRTASNRAWANLLELHPA